MSQTIDLTPEPFKLITSYGATLSLTLKFFSDPERTIPIDLTAAELIHIDVKWKDKDGPVKLELRIGNGLTISGDDDNHLVILKNQRLKPGNYVMDVALRFPGDIDRHYAEINHWTIEKVATVLPLPE